MNDGSDGTIFTATDTKVLGRLLKEAEIDQDKREYGQQNGEGAPGVFITDSDVDSLIHSNAI
jgi:hypothetical protein